MARDQDRKKFVELAEKRVARAIKDLRLIGNLANKNNYSYTDQDAEKIISVLEVELKVLRRKFEAKGNSGEITFKL